MEEVKLGFDLMSGKEGDGGFNRTDSLSDAITLSDVLVVLVRLSSFFFPIVAFVFSLWEASSSSSSVAHMNPR